MKFVGVREAQQKLSGLVDKSQKEHVVLTRHGQPVAIVTGIEGQDLEEILLAENPLFRALVAERRRSRAALVSHEELRARAEKESKEESRLRRKQGRLRVQSKSR